LNVLIWVTGHCNRAAVSRNRYGVEKTVDTHKIFINAIKFYVCLQEIWSDKTMCEVLWRNISDYFYVNLRVEVADVSKNRYGVEKTVDTHRILINAIKCYVCLQEIW
jgi:hypothetical protein